MDWRDWQRLTRGIRTRFAELLRRSILTRLDASTKLQTVQVKAIEGEVLDGMEYFEPYGFTSKAFTGAEPLVATVEGKRGHEVVICIADRRYRLKDLQDGEVALFDDQGNQVWLQRDQVYIKAVTHLEAEAPTTKITSTTTHMGDVTIKGALTVNGQIVGTETLDVNGAVTSGTSIADPNGTMQEMRDTYDGHDHDYDDNGANNTTQKAKQQM